MAENKNNYKISDNFTRGDFACACGFCNSEFKMSLSLIGILEHLKAKFAQDVKIHRAYVCEHHAKELFGSNKDYHHLGKAVDISINNVEMKDVFLEVERLEEVTGLGLVPAKGIIHIDMRDKERNIFVDENGTKTDLTEEKRKRYGLA